MYFSKKDEKVMTAFTEQFCAVRTLCIISILCKYILL